MKPHLYRDSTTFLLSAFVALSCAAVLKAQEKFVRGDMNADGDVSMADAGFFIDGTLFQGPAPGCLDTADVDNDGTFSPSDAVYLLNWLFASGPQPPAPFPAPGLDPATPPDNIPCAVYKVTPPGNPHPGYTMSWETPGALFVGQKDVEIFLRATTLEPIEGFSIALRLNRKFLKNARVDLAETLPGDKLGPNFEGSGLFRTKLLSVANTDFDLLLAGAIFVRDLALGQGGGAGMPQKVLLGPLVKVPILRLVVDVRDDAPAGGDPVQILFPAGTAHLVPGVAGALHGIRNEFLFDSILGMGPIVPGGVFFGEPLIVDAGTILRADSNRDQEVDLSDAVHTLAYLFTGGPRPDCLDEADSNKDRTLDLSDAVFTLAYLFTGGPEPEDWPSAEARALGAVCGIDFDGGRLQDDCALCPLP